MLYFLFFAQQQLKIQSSSIFWNTTVRLCFQKWGSDEASGSCVVPYTDLPAIQLYFDILVLFDAVNDVFIENCNC